MIYEAYLDDNLLYYPNDETYAILNSTLQLALNEAGSFEFDIPTSNIRYDDFKLRKSMIKVSQNGEEIFYGEVREVKVNSDFTKHIYAVGELAFLFDSIQPQGRYLTSPLSAVTDIINYHNSQVEARKRFKIAHIDVTDSDNQIYFYTNGEDTLSILRQKICDTLDGYIQITKDATGDRYISIVPMSYFGQCTQEIQFGENLLDYSCNMSASDIATCVVPRGVKLEEDKRTADAVEGLDEYLTIKGTTADYYHKNVSDDFVQLDEAIANFGYVRVLKSWDDVTIAENLKAKATEWLKSAQYEAMTLELKALDMSQLDVNIDSFRLGDSVRVWALPYGMDTYLPVRKKTIYLQELQKNEVVLGNTVRKSYTSQASEAVTQLKEEIPEEESVLSQALSNAVSLLTDSSKGYVTYVFDANGNRTEIWIADNMDSTKATKKWVWNSSGLGYMYLDKGVWKSSVAITMDGRINADFITAGILTGLEINNGNGTFHVDTNGSVTANKGYIAGFEIETKEVTPSLVEDALVHKHINGSQIRLAQNTNDGHAYISMNENGKVTTLSPYGLTTSGSVEAKDYIYTNGKITAGGDIVTDGDIYSHNFYAYEDGNYYKGKDTKTFSFKAYVNGSEKYVGMTFIDGLLVGTSNLD